MDDGSRMAIAIMNSIVQPLASKRKRGAGQEFPVVGRAAPRAASKPRAARANSDDGPALSETQQCIVQAVVRDRRNAFITGGGGVGKTVVVNAIRSRLDTAVILAPTGLAAMHIRGQTVHTFLGDGLASGTVDEVVARVGRKPWVLKRMRDADTLLIEEISMVDRDMFEKLDRAMRLARSRPDAPFGGVHIVLVGDFYQLPPPTRERHAPYCFLSPVWDELGLSTFALTDVFRHHGDPMFAEAMLRVRRGCPTDDDWRMLDSRVGVTPTRWKELDIKPTRLYPYRASVDSINDAFLRQLDGPERLYKATWHTHKRKTEGRTQHAPAPEELNLRVGAQVICVANLKDLGLVNGSRGVVTGWSTCSASLPIVRFESGATHTMPVHTWSDHRLTPVYSQIPMCLAYALTIHKSQGMTLSAVEISLSGVFENGQAYVALSRATSLDAITLTGPLNRSVVRVDPAVTDFYAKLAAPPPPSPPPPPKEDDDPATTAAAESQ